MDPLLHCYLWIHLKFLPLFPSLFSEIKRKVLAFSQQKKIYEISEYGEPLLLINSSMKFMSKLNLSFLDTYVVAYLFIHQPIDVLNLVASSHALFATKLSYLTRLCILNSRSLSS